MNKNALREKYKHLRKQFSTDKIEQYSIAIANNTLHLNIWNYSYYHVFLSIAEKKEVDTHYLLTILQGKDKEIVVSKSDFTSNTLSHYLLTDNTALRVNKYGIPEPVGGIQITEDKIEVVFIPLLAFDVFGNRVGYGKGFYDRFLAKCKPNTVKIGLSFFEPEKEVIKDANANDVKLNYCITPNKVYSFS